MHKLNQIKYTIYKIYNYCVYNIQFHEKRKDEKKKKRKEMKWLFIFQGEREENLYQHFKEEPLQF